MGVVIRHRRRYRTSLFGVRILVDVQPRRTTIRAATPYNDQQDIDKFQYLYLDLSSIFFVFP